MRPRATARTLRGRAEASSLALAVRVVTTGRRAAQAVRRDDRGDVPGWVLVTMMTAGLVIGLWRIADERLRTLFETALDQVVGPR